MRWNKIEIIFGKELRDTLRDRRTLIAMIVIPVLLFPVLMLTLPDLIIRQATKESLKVSRVAIMGEQLSPDPGKAPELRAVLVGGLLGQTLELVEQADPLKALEKGELHAVVAVPKDFYARLLAERQTTLRIYYDSGETRSEFARRKVEDQIRRYRRDILLIRLDKKDESALEPVLARVEDVAPPEKRTGSIVGKILPYIIIVLCLTGAMYPAIDLTAGEKERGTLETLLVSPAGRFELVVGKFLTVLLTSIVTAALASLSLWVTFHFGADRLKMMMGAASSPPAQASEQEVSEREESSEQRPEEPSGAQQELPAAETGKEAKALPQFEFKLSPLAVAMVFVMLLPLACLFSALLIALATFAKSYKEAMSYISPLMIVVIVPAMLSMIPGFEPKFELAFIPVANVSLVMMDILKASFQWDLIALTFALSAVYAILGMALTAWLFQRERTLFRS